MRELSEHEALIAEYLADFWPHAVQQQVLWVLLSWQGWTHAPLFEEFVRMPNDRQEAIFMFARTILGVTRL